MDKNLLKTTYLFKQQQLLLDYTQKYLGLEPFASAMDKAGHYILLSLETIDDLKKDKTCVASITAFTLGTHKDKKIDFVKVGNVYFSKVYNYPIEILTLYCNIKYKGNGIGKILLQAVENFAIENQVSEIMVQSMLNKTRLKGKEFPSRKDFDSFEEYEKAVRYELSIRDDKYFDKNYYFYYSQGYSPAKLPQIIHDSKNTIAMSKTSLKYRPLTKSALNKIRDCKPTDQRFEITEFHRQNCAGPDSSNFDNKEIDPKKFDVQPFILQPTEESFNFVKSTLNQNIEQNFEG